MSGGVISQAQWNAYINLMKAAHNDFMSHDIVWLKSKARNRAPYGEDSIEDYTPITLKVLKNFNVMRTWPIVRTTETGEIEAQSIQLFFSKPMLKDLGYVVDGKFDYRPDYDRFEHEGKIWKPAGDTPAAQVYEDDLLYTIIIRPEEKSTG